MSNDLNDNLYDDMRQDRLHADALFARRVVDRWVSERAALRRRRRVLATIGPLAAAAVLVLVAVFIHHRLQLHQHQRRLAAGRALTSLVRDAQVASAFQPRSIHRAIDTTTDLFSTDIVFTLLRDDADAPPTETAP